MDILTPQGAATIEIYGETLWLMPELAAFSPTSSSLFVADVHFGKAAAFRASGVPVPGGTSERACERLTEIIGLTRPKAIYFLGDLWHAKEGRADATVETVRTWRESHSSIEMVLVVGNHDLKSGALPQAMGMREVSEPHSYGRFSLCHDPAVEAEGYVLAGHIHPCVELNGRGGQSMRLPCFLFSEGGAILPAFGEFTGCAKVRPRVGDRVYVVAEDKVRSVALPRDG
jgi:DNA ligase-associated metallophosphoesterase